MEARRAATVPDAANVATAEGAAARATAATQMLVQGETALARKIATEALEAGGRRVCTVSRDVPAMQPRLLAAGWCKAHMRGEP